MEDRNLECNIKLISGTEYMVTLTENESCDTAQYTFTIDRKGETDMKEKIGNEILSWVEMMLDEREEENA